MSVDHLKSAPEAVNGSAPAEVDNAPTVMSKSLHNRQAYENSFTNLLRGRKLAHFQLEEPLGVGGMAAVIRARDLHLDRPVALKILPPEMAAEPENVQRFRQEARSAAKLDHENIARVYYCGEDQGLNFIAFEYVEGQNLRAMIEERGRIPVAEAIHYVLQIAAGLSHAVVRGVVHRDVKPSNIIVEESGRAKLVDMGLARSQGVQPDRGLTQSGVTLGTFDYISPEQALEPREADVRSDIYSLGCTFYHMVTGQPPVPEGTAARKLQFHQQGSPVDPRQLNPEIPDEVAAILSRMIAKDPKDRYQEPEHLVQHLLAVAQKLPGRANAVGNSSSVVYVDSILPNPPRVRPLAVFTIAAAAVMILVGILGFFTHSDPPPRPELTPVARMAQAKPVKESSAAPVVEAEPDPSAELITKPPSPKATAESKQRMEELTQGFMKFVELLSKPKTQPNTAPEVATATPTAPRVEPIVAPDLIVDGEGKQPGTFATLSRALSEADSKKVEEEIVIVLRVNGLLPVRQQEIGNRRVVIRAATGFSPELTFHSDSSPGADGEIALFLVRDGDLTLEKINVRLEPNLQRSAKLQAFVAITGAGHCKLKSCLGTLKGDADVRMTLVSIADPTGAMMGNAGKPPPIGFPAVEIEDAFVRGQGDLVSVRVSRPYRLEIQNALTVLTGTLLNVEGNRQLLTTPASVSLKNVTAYVSHHIIALRSNAMAPAQVPLEVSAAERCIFAAAEARPLFWVEGVENEEEFKRRFRWKGRDIIYSTPSSDALLVYQPSLMMTMADRYNRDRWSALWGPNDDPSRFAQVRFAGLPLGSRPFSETAPADFHVKEIPEMQPNILLDVPGAKIERLPVPAAENFPDDELASPARQRFAPSTPSP